MLHAETDTAPVESAWVELRARLDLNDDFWLGFVWAPVTSWLDRLERYTTDYLLGHGKQIEKNLGPHAGRPANASKVLADLDAKAPLLWIRWEPAHDPQLAAATPTFHEFFNRSRDILRRTRPGGIVLAGHHDGRVPFRNACPDLWSYRSLDVEQAISRLPVTPTIVDVNLSFDVDEMILKSQRLK